MKCRIIEPISHSIPKSGTQKHLYLSKGTLSLFYLVLHQYISFVIIEAHRRMILSASTFWWKGVVLQACHSHLV